MQQYTSSICYLILLLFINSCSNETALHQIIDRHTQALGGKEHLEQIHTVVKVRNPVVLTIDQKPEKLIVQVFGKDSSILYAEGTDGETAWELQGENAKKVVLGKPAIALEHTVQWPGNLRPLFSAKERGHQLELIGKDSVEQQSYYKILMTLNDGFKRFYWINSETFFIERAQDHRELHAYQEDKKNLVTKWSNWQKVGGYWFATREETWDIDKNELVSGGDILNIIVNPEIDNKLFTTEGNFIEYELFQQFLNQ